jgi:hypothetical protein
MARLEENEPQAQKEKSHQQTTVVCCTRRKRAWLSRIRITQIAIATHHGDVQRIVGHGGGHVRLTHGIFCAQQGVISVRMSLSYFAYQTRTATGDAYGRISRGGIVVAESDPTVLTGTRGQQKEENEPEGRRQNRGNKSHVLCWQPRFELDP